VHGIWSLHQNYFDNLSWQISNHLTWYRRAFGKHLPVDWPISRCFDDLLLGSRWTKVLQTQEPCHEVILQWGCLKQLQKLTGEYAHDCSWPCAEFAIRCDVGLASRHTVDNVPSRNITYLALYLQVYLSSLEQLRLMWVNLWSTSCLKTFWLTWWKCAWCWHHNWKQMCMWVMHVT